MKSSLSPKDLARLLDVSESSIKRWIDDGVILATRTHGGHRRISLEEATRLQRHYRLAAPLVADPAASAPPVSDTSPVTPADATPFGSDRDMVSAPPYRAPSSPLVSAAVSADNDPASPIHQPHATSQPRSDAATQALQVKLAELLLDHDRDAFHDRITRICFEGHSVLWVCQHLLQPILARIARQSASDAQRRLAVGLAADICAESLQHLRRVHRPAHKHRPLAAVVSLNAAADLPLLAIMVAAILSEIGYRDVAAAMPVEPPDLPDLIGRHQPDLLCLIGLPSHARSTRLQSVISPLPQSPRIAWLVPATTSGSPQTLTAENIAATDTTSTDALTRNLNNPNPTPTAEPLPALLTCRFTELDTLAHFAHLNLAHPLPAPASD